MYGSAFDSIADYYIKWDAAPYHIHEYCVYISYMSDNEFNYNSADLLLCMCTHADFLDCHAVEPLY